MKRITATRMATLPNTAPKPGSMILLSPPMPSAARIVPRSFPTPPSPTTRNEPREYSRPDRGPPLPFGAGPAAGDPPPPRPEGESERVHPPRADAETRGHPTVLRHRADAQSRVGLEKQ